MTDIPFTLRDPSGTIAVPHVCSFRSFGHVIGHENGHKSTKNYISLSHSLSLMEALEELTRERVNDLSLEEAKVLFEEREILVSRVRSEMDLLRGKIWPAEKEERCERCGSTNLRFLARGGYFCRKCGFRHGLSDIIVGS